MYLIYLDESGSPDLADDSPYYVVSALIINEKEIFKVRDLVCNLKRKYFPDADPNEIEIHMKDLAHHRGVFKDLGLENERKLIREIGDLIPLTNCTLTTVCMNKAALYGDHKEHVLEFALKFLFERVCTFLDEYSGIERHRPEFGILMLDSISPQMDNKIRIQMMGLIKNGTEYRRSEYFLDQPMFVRSCDDHIMQLADYASYCMKRRIMGELDKNEDNRKMYREITDKLQPRFLAYGKKGLGLKIYP